MTTPPSSVTMTPPPSVTMTPPPSSATMTPPSTDVDDSGISLMESAQNREEFTLELRVETLPDTDVEDPLSVEEVVNSCVVETAAPVGTWECGDVIHADNVGRECGDVIPPGDLGGECGEVIPSEVDMRVVSPTLSPLELSDIQILSDTIEQLTSCATNDTDTRLDQATLNSYPSDVLTDNITMDNSHDVTHDTMHDLSTGLSEFSELSSTELCSKASTEFTVNSSYDKVSNVSECSFDKVRTDMRIDEDVAKVGITLCYSV